MNDHHVQQQPAFSVPIFINGLAMLYKLPLINDYLENVTNSRINSDFTLIE